MPDLKKIVEDELVDVRKKLGNLQTEEEVLSRIIKKTHGRTEGVQDFISLLVEDSGDNGITTIEAEMSTLLAFPTVGKTTVKTILSRLKGYGIFLYRDGKYFIRKEVK